MKKTAVIVAALVAAPSLAFTAPVFADSPGQLSNGPDNYKVRNVTQNTDYARSTSATCGETVKYSITLANSDHGLLSNVTVKANLGTGNINASATNASKETTSASGNVTVNVAKGNLSYISGTTVRVDTDSKRTQLADGVVLNGVNAGDLNGSTQTFVQFEAKVVCETTPVTPETPVTPTTPTNNTTKPQVKSTNTQKPAVIAATGPASTIATMTGLSALAAGIGYFVQRRRNILG